MHSKILIACKVLSICYPVICKDWRVLKILKTDDQIQMKEMRREKQQSRDQLGQRVNTMSSGQIKNIENETFFFFFNANI